jgi:Helix-turn-helix
MNDSLDLLELASDAMDSPAVATVPAPAAPGEMPGSEPPASTLLAAPAPAASQTTPAPKPSRGSVLLNALMLRRLRESRLLSQQDVADDCWRRNIQLSIATIKRVERSHRVRFRIAHTLAGYYGVPVDDLLS